ncbi:hypothetical protein [Xenorhabdus bovienii]|uniref:hypothetical protein n=1 Tax=Xenorhabdus bovienii TaxID=40576 RepID=UPI001E5BC014|nr:hypothetical protein [Xenorhabdus bovienii]
MHIEMPEQPQLFQYIVSNAHIQIIGFCLDTGSQQKIKLVVRQVKPALQADKAVQPIITEVGYGFDFTPVIRPNNFQSILLSGINVNPAIMISGREGGGALSVEKNRVGKVDIRGNDRPVVTTTE